MLLYWGKLWMWYCDFNLVKYCEPNDNKEQNYSTTKGLMTEFFLRVYFMLPNEQWDGMKELFVDIDSNIRVGFGYCQLGFDKAEYNYCLTLWYCTRFCDDIKCGMCCVLFV